MTIEQVKAEVKKRFGRDITDQEAKAWLESSSARELQEDELQNAAGGGCNKKHENVNGPCHCGCTTHYVWHLTTSPDPYDPGEIVYECTNCHARLD